MAEDQDDDSWLYGGVFCGIMLTFSLTLLPEKLFVIYFRFGLSYNMAAILFTIMDVISLSMKKYISPIIAQFPFLPCRDEFQLFAMFC